MSTNKSIQDWGMFLAGLTRSNSIPIKGHEVIDWVNRLAKEKGLLCLWSFECHEDAEVGGILLGTWMVSLYEYEDAQDPGRVLLVLTPMK